MSPKHAWFIYYNNAVEPISKFEKYDNTGHGTGLLLRECPACHSCQTRESYLEGFSQNHYTLVQGLSVLGIEQCCSCGQWLRIYS